MRVIYFLRVLLISGEAFAVMLGALAWLQFRPLLEAIAGDLRPNEELLKFLILLPVGLLVWISSEIRSLLYEDKETTRLLMGLPDYQRLKMHVWVSLAYALTFTVVSLAPWVAGSGVTTAWGLLLFVGSALGQLTVASSVYLARLRIKEFVATVGHRPTPN